MNEVVTITKETEAITAMKRINDIFGSEQVMLTCGVITYMFDSASEAMMFIVYKENTVNKTVHIEFCTNSINISIDGCIEKYNIKSLKVYQYQKNLEKLKRETEEINSILENRPFIEDIDAKTKLMTKEFRSYFRSYKPNEISLLDQNNKIKNLIDRYFGKNGYTSYWLTAERLSENSIELTLHVELKDSNVIDITQEVIIP